MTGHRVDITRYGDGKSIEQSTVTDEEWPHQDFVEFELTRGNGAWISKCVMHGNEYDSTMSAAPATVSEW
jgi:hypothetical protein